MDFSVLVAERGVQQLRKPYSGLLQLLPDDWCVTSSILNRRSTVTFCWPLPRWRLRASSNIAELGESLFAWFRLSRRPAFTLLNTVEVWIQVIDVSTPSVELMRAGANERDFVLEPEQDPFAPVLARCNLIQCVGAIDFHYRLARHSMSLEIR